jgi:hypothetical protein
MKRETYASPFAVRIMKTTVFIAIAGLAAATVLAQYCIDWHTVDGGGGSSTGGVYAVSGTIGQPDAGGPMTGGPYSLTGGFWAITLVQTPGAPTLCITNAAPGFATIWWTPPTSSYVLQFTDSLAPTNWVNAPSGTNNPVTVMATASARFYRLFKP